MRNIFKYYSKKKCNTVYVTRHACGADVLSSPSFKDGEMSSISVYHYIDEKNYLSGKQFDTIANLSLQKRATD
jgi:hypothetical protein